MVKTLNYALSILICMGAAGVMAGDALPAAPTPIIVLEATTRHAGVGGYDAPRLLVRLTGDGKIEWDKVIARGVLERQTGTLSADVVAEVQRTVDKIDQSIFRKQMGPYYSYIDTSEELHVRIHAKAGPLRFSLLNPWDYSGMPLRPMPHDVRLIVCEIDALYAQQTNSPVSSTCKNSDLWR